MHFAKIALSPLFISNNILTFLSDSKLNITFESFTLFIIILKYIVCFFELVNLHSN